MNRWLFGSGVRDRHVRLAALVLLFVALALSVAWIRDPQTQTTIEGEVINGTPDGAVPDGISVTLHSFFEMEETAVYTTTAAEDHSFRFEDVTLQEGHTVVARVVYEGVTYVSDFLTVEQDQQTVQLPVTIYETTEHPADISISQLHLFVERSGERMQVGEYAVITNAGDRTYVGSGQAGGTTWTVALPENAENLTFESGALGGRFVPVENGFADTRPVPPGEGSVEVSFTYEVPFREGLEIEQSFDVPVRAAVLVMPEGNYGLQGAGLSAEGALDTEMGAALSYTAGPLRAGQPLAFRLVPRAAGGSDASGAGPGSGLTAGVVAVAVAGAVVGLMWLSPSPGPVPSAVRGQVEAIAALDRDYRSGEVSEKAYRERRNALKQRLRKRLSDAKR